MVVPPGCEGQVKSSQWLSLLFMYGLDLTSSGETRWGVHRKGRYMIQCEENHTSATSQASRHAPAEQHRSRLSRAWQDLLRAHMIMNSAYANMGAISAQSAAAPRSRRSQDQPRVLLAVVSASAVVRGLVRSPPAWCVTGTEAGLHQNVQSARLRPRREAPFEQMAVSPREALGAFLMGNEASCLMRPNEPIALRGMEASRLMRPNEPQSRAS